MKNQTIVINLDNTICTAEEDYSRCIPKEHAITALNMLKKDNNFITINTGRHLDHARITIAWLKENNIPFDHIQFGKPPAKFYVDERAYKFTSWGKFLKDMHYVGDEFKHSDPIEYYEAVFWEVLGGFKTDYKMRQKISRIMAKTKKEIRR